MTIQINPEVLINKLIHKSFMYL